MIIHELEQGTVEWFSVRAGIPTASEFKKLITSTGEPSKQMRDYALTLAAELYAGKPVDAWEGNQWTNRGSEMEAEAAEAYRFLYGHELTQVGFITDDEKLYGCSPDRLVGDEGMLEIKCLKAENHIKALMYFKKHGKCPTDYVPQTQGQMLIAERKWNDLFFYHPELPQFCIRQEINQAVIDGLKAQIEAVIAERDLIMQTLEAA